MNIIALLIVVFWLPKLLGGNKPLAKAPQNIAILGFFISVIFSQLSNFYIGGAIQAFAAMLPNVFLYFCIANLVDTEKKLKIFIWLLILLTTYVAIHGIVLSTSGAGIRGTTLIGGRIRYIGTLSDPNDLALAFVIVIPFLINFASNQFSFLSRLVSWFCLLIIFYGLILTESRGGLLSLASVIMCYVYKKYGRIQSFIITGVFMIVLVNYVATTRMTDIDIHEASAHGRIEGMAHAFWLLKTNVKNFIFGAGFGRIADEYSFVAHNTFMHVTGETGFIGLFFFISFMYYSCKGLLVVGQNIKPVLRPLNALAVSLLSSFVGFFVATLFLTRCYNETIYILVGCAVSIVHLAQQDNASFAITSSLNDTRWIFIATFTLIVLSYIIVKIFFS